MSIPLAQRVALPFFENVEENRVETYFLTSNLAKPEKL